MSSQADEAECSKRKKPHQRLPKEQIYKAIGLEHVRTQTISMPRSTKCTLCGAIKLGQEVPTMCCYNGEVLLAPIWISDALTDLYTRNDKYGMHFRQYSRLYNNFFAFSSLGGNIEAETRSGIHTLQLLGQLYHFLPKLVPSDNKPNFLQMYFYDGALELDARSKRFASFADLLPEVIETLMHITSSNPYARFFRSLRNSNVSEQFKIGISKNPVLDQTVYNAPTSDEVAVILVDDDSSDVIHSPEIVVHAHGDQPHRVMHYYGCYDPLQYPLLFCRGESGWSQGLPRRKKGTPHIFTNNSFPVSAASTQTASDLITSEVLASQRKAPKAGKEISCREYYAFYFQVRTTRSIVNAGRIFLQYIIDMYVKIENTRLDFIRKNQTRLRSELYQGIVDSVNDGVCSASSVGKRIILPASFIGGPRDMKQRYLNAMTLVQRFGKPDLFITMTCNPHWPEVTSLLLPGESHQDRPDIIARVFRCKLTTLKNELYKNNIFGKVAARVDVVEFQKRGLPHAHLLIILKDGHKIKNPDMYDQYVCAELPPKENFHLRSLVTKHMMHGPCGKFNPKCGCMKIKDYRSICRFHYPKDYADSTTSTDECYPVYRRRNNDDSVKVRGQHLDNRWVTPYNPYLLAAFDCHINVEICSTVQAVKYIYKYIYKGHDKICFNIEKNHMKIQDEPQAFQMARWVTPPEAAYRIFGFDLYDMFPSVTPLQIHLPDMQPTAFPESVDIRSIMEDENRKTTMLTAYFTANSTIDTAPSYLYFEFPEWFVWDKSAKMWKKRKNKRTSIGRLIYVSPSEGERYYLRLLLCNIRGATSFESLKTVDGHVCNNFREACERHGFLQQDNYVDACIVEAVNIHMPHALRRLFATLLTFVDGSNSQVMWRKFYPSLSEDFSYKYPDNEDKVALLTYCELEKYLETLGRKISSYDIPLPNNWSTYNFKTTRDWYEVANAPTPSEFINAADKLNIDQRRAYDGIMDAVMHNRSQSFFIDGPGGSGKTFLYCAIYAKLRYLGKIVLPTATSGIAASNIPTGRTAHSRFKIPIDTCGSYTCSVSKQSSLASILQKASLILWDEASMAKKADVEALDLLLQDICDSKLAFGGKIVFFGGDFRQVLPVLSQKSQEQCVNASLVNSYLWPKLTKFTLSENVRAKDDMQFSNLLLQLGNGSLQNAPISRVLLPDDIISCEIMSENATHHIIDYIYPKMSAADFDPYVFSDRAILTPTNEGVDSINTQVIAAFDGSCVTYTGIDSLIDENSNLCSPEFLNSLCPPGMSPYKLVLKKNCPVILLRNIDPANGLCNGTRMICKEFHKNIIVCEISSGYYKGEHVFLPRIILRPTSSSKCPFEFQRRQFPIKLCFAMTINKAQGQTLQRVCVYLRESCFSHGQLYVALSRAKRREDLKVFITPTSMATDGTKAIINVVSFDILCRAQIL